MNAPHHLPSVDNLRELATAGPRPNAVEDVSANDQSLILRCRAGDVDAFGGLVVRYQDRLYATLVHLLGSLEDARDVTQDAFVLAFEKLATFRGDSAFYSWLFRIAYNAAMTRKRKERRVPKSIDAVREQRGDDLRDGRADTDPGAAIDSEERQQLVRKALDELGEDYRTAIILKEIDGLRYDEIAVIVGCPIGTVRSRIHRARHELREKLSRTIKTQL
ncbi:MAG: sigma-70 family RNA polymerase sigma factor [Planctomycetaceae bacterium]